MNFASVTVIPVNGEGPEDVLVDANGRIYTGLSDGRIVRISGDGVIGDVTLEIPGRARQQIAGGDVGIHERHHRRNVVQRRRADRDADLARNGQRGHRAEGPERPEQREGWGRGPLPPLRPFRPLGQ